MKQNISIVPMLFSKEAKLSAKMFYGFFKMGKARYFPKRDYHYNHFKNLSLVYFKLTAACNLRCVMCGQYGDKGIMKDCAAEETKKTLPLETWKKFIDEIAPQKPVTYIWGGEPFLYKDLLPLVKYMVDKGLFVSVNTNGTLMEKHAEDIVRDKRRSVFV
jgi:MoaA/NifB/PqqE/SkfB family radical SAM enzyme